MTAGRKRVLIAGGALALALGAFAWARARSATGTGASVVSVAGSLGYGPAWGDVGAMLAPLPADAAVTWFQPQITPAPAPANMTTGGAASYVPLFGFIADGGYGLGAFA